MLIIIEGLVMCLFLLLFCVIGIANGPAGLVVLYEQDVQTRVVELGLTTREKINRSLWVFLAVLYLPYIFVVPAMVYGINGAATFWDGFWQMTAIFLIQNVFDRLFMVSWATLPMKKPQTLIKRFMTLCGNEVLPMTEKVFETPS